MTPAVVEAPRAGQPSPQPPSGREQPPPLDDRARIARFDRPTRLLHVVIMVTFLGLSATGMPLLFSEAPWARLLAALFGGFRGAGLVHRFFGATLLAAVAWHVGNVFYRAFARGEKGLFWGPT